MEPVFFPLDEELALLPGQLAPRQQEHLAHLAAWMPFQQATWMLFTLLGVQTSAETARRLTEQMGAWMDMAQTAEAASTRSASEEPSQPERCVLSVDGAMISLVKKQWVEVRTLAIGEPKAVCGTNGEREIHVGQLSYFSQLADASTFTKLAGVEMRRRRVAEAEAVCAVTDGAEWCQAFAESYRPDAVRILDFPHAAEHLSKLLEALEQAGVHFPEQMFKRCLHILKHRGPRFLRRMAEQMPSDLSQHSGVEVHLDYLRKREALMQYRAFRAQGWPIGSGMVESANKNVVQARLKGSGMHWERSHVNPMLALRLAVCNERWQEMWQEALMHHRRLQRLQSSVRAEHRAQAFLAVGDLPSQKSRPFPSAATSQERAPCTPSRSPSKPVSLPLPPPVSAGTQLSSCRLFSRRKQHTAKNRVKYSHPKSGEASGETCVCGTPFVQSRGSGRRKEYCSNRCRQRAYRWRQGQAFCGA